MPSLIYITRIRPLPAELAQALASSGSHVKSFGPGEITADECILVMTSEAILAGLRVPGLPPVSGRAGAQGPQSQATPSHHDVHKRAEAAVWESIKAAEVVEPAVGKSAGAPGLGYSLPAAVRGDGDLSFVPSQTALLATAELNAGTVPRALSARRESAGREKDQGSDQHPVTPLLPAPAAGKVPMAAVGLPTLSKKTCLSGLIFSVDGRRYGRFWRPATLAAAILVLGLVLLAGRASVFSSKAEVAATGHEAQPSTRPETSSNLPNLPEATPHKSSNDFVAEDYTTRFALQGNRRTVPQTPDLRPEAQNRPIPKRVVDN